MASYRSLIAVIFLLSGVSALIYQVVWQRVLTQEIGVDAISIAYIITIFMTGLGFGAWFGGRHAKGKRSDRLRDYGLLEVAIGIFGLLSIPLMRFLNRAAAPLIVDIPGADFLLNALVLLPPTFMMGFTTPLLMYFMRNQLKDWASTVGYFYGANILGAGLGALLSGYLLIEFLGLQGSAVVAAAINLGIGAYFLKLAREAAVVEIAPANDSHNPLPTKAFQLGPGLAVTCFVFGFITLSLEMILIRMLTNHFTGVAIVFPTLLACYLINMAAGEYVYGKMADRYWTNYPLTLFASVFIGGTLVLAVLTNVPPDALIKLGLHQFAIQKYPTLGFMLWSLVFMTPIFFFSGLLPLMVKAVTKHVDHGGTAFGSVLFFSTMGNIAGAYLSPLVLFNAIGSINTLYVTIGLGLLGLIPVSFLLVKSGRGGAVLLAAVVATCGLVTLVPSDYYLRFPYFKADRESGELKNWKEAVEVIEGKSGVVTVYGEQAVGYNVMAFRSPTAGARPNIQDDGHIADWNLAPLFALDPTFRPKKVLIIGLGSGRFAYSMAQYPFVEKVVVIELMQEVASGVMKYIGEDFKKHVDSGKIELIVADGRRFVQNALARNERYDFVQIGIQQPHESGAGNLYSVEFFAKAKQLLNDNGYVAFMKRSGITRAGLEVFKHCMIFQPGDKFGVLTDKLPDFPEELPISDFWSANIFAKTFGDAQRLEFSETGDLKIQVLGREELGKWRLNTDDHPIVEYSIFNNLLRISPDPVKGMGRNLGQTHVVKLRRVNQSAQN